ncbi:MAG: hypothetical protein PHP50_08865 [Lachnospiraceae bacterium]|nr:hypothetical protein [Lachnospiraceae bacterium]
MLDGSSNSYDWLGNGIYFWEDSYQRARDWAEKRYHEKGAVIGAIIDLGYCLNLTDYNSTDILQKGYLMLKTKVDILGKKMPQNRMGKSKTDVLLRDLDCAVIQQLHEYNRETGSLEYDSVRGAFTEGGEIYPGSAFVEKTHIQL